MDSIAPQRSRGIDRAIALLECLHDARRPLRIAELAERLKAPRSTIYELVERFMRAGLLARYGEGSVFFGRTVYFYGADYLAVNDFSRRAQAAVQQLAEATRQTAQFTTLRGNKYTVQHMAWGNRLFRISADIGVPVPIPWTASGRLLLGHLSQADIVALIPPADFTLPDGRRIAPEVFCREVARASADGFCVTRGLVDDFTSCMAAAVRDSHGVVVGCLCLVVPIAAGGHDALLRGLCDAATALARETAGLTLPPPAVAVADETRPE